MKILISNPISEPIEPTNDPLQGWTWRTPVVQGRRRHSQVPTGSGGSLLPSAGRILALMLGTSLAAPVAFAGVHYERLRSFGVRSPDAREPHAPLIQGSDGALYGTTSVGGTGYVGTVFRLNQDGSGYSNLHHFGSGPCDGANPQTAVVEGSDGMLYGTTVGGGSYGGGTVFKVSKDGQTYAILHNFNNNGLDGTNPQGALLVGSDGALYGTTSEGGAYTNQYGSGGGTLFKLNADGSGYGILHNFGAKPDDGVSPSARLTQGSDGALYGTTNARLYGQGTIFSVNMDGTGYRVLHNFWAGGADGFGPTSPLVEGTDGMLYGTTLEGPVTTNGGTGNGCVFRLSKNGEHYSVLHALDPVGATEGIGPNGLIEGRDGALYGTTSDGGLVGGFVASGTVFKLDKDGSGYSVLHAFLATDLGDGLSPWGTPTQGNDGALYSTTQRGGDNAAGTVFKLNADGTGYEVIFSFNDSNTDGAHPIGSLLAASDGALYGTTTDGGTHLGFGGHAGIAYKLNLDGSGYTILHEFGSTAEDGRLPYAGLVEGSGGVLYGTTSDGGAYTNQYGYGGGTIFKLNKDGTGYVVLRSFKGGSGPAFLTVGSDGALYGTAAGTVFRLNTDGSGFGMLHSFNFGSDGSPSHLIEGSDGALYGTTGGDRGTVFRLNKDGTGYTVLHTMSAFGLIEGHDRILYGLASLGEYSDMRIVFAMNKDGSGYEVLHSFNAAWPAGLVEGGDGALYGISTPDFDLLPTSSVFLFKLNKDGSGYTVLYTLKDGSEFGNGLVKGRDGAFYGSSSYGGDLGLGMIYKIWPPETPDLLKVAVQTSTAHVTVAGVNGSTYQLLGSTDLINWTVLDAITMPASGTYTNTYSTSSTGHAFYRAAWVPQP
jgi:uncharacterized repeat protein (TIGR03803 family)